MHSAARGVGSGARQGSGRVVAVEVEKLVAGWEVVAVVRNRCALDSDSFSSDSFSSMGTVVAGLRWRLRLQTAESAALADTGVEDAPSFSCCR